MARWHLGQGGGLEKHYGDKSSEWTHSYLLGQLNLRDHVQVLCQSELVSRFSEDFRSLPVICLLFIRMEFLPGFHDANYCLKAAAEVRHKAFRRGFYE